MCMWVCKCEHEGPSHAVALVEFRSRQTRQAGNESCAPEGLPWTVFRRWQVAAVAHHCVWPPGRVCDLLLCLHSYELNLQPLL